METSNTHRIVQRRASPLISVNLLSHVCIFTHTRTTKESSSGMGKALVLPVAAGGGCSTFGPVSGVWWWILSYSFDAQCRDSLSLLSGI